MDPGVSWAAYEGKERSLRQAVKQYRIAARNRGKEFDQYLLEKQLEFFEEDLLTRLPAQIEQFREIQLTAIRAPCKGELPFSSMVEEKLCGGILPDVVER